MNIRLSKWAELNGYSKRGAYELFRKGRIPHAFQNEAGTILVNIPDPIKTNNNVEIYARVSSNKQKNDLITQIDRITAFCNANGFVITKIHKEIASGLNDNRTVLNNILNNIPNKLIIENKDRLTRFGFNYINTLFQKNKSEIIIMNPTKNDENELMTDFVSIITSMCARVYGLRKCKNKRDIILQELSK